MHAIVEERWREERRGRILDAAGRVFSRHSYHGASMDEIAHEAQVGKPTLYRYFPSKDALFAAVFVEALDDLEARLQSVLDDTAAVEAQLAALVAEIVPLFRDHLVSLRLLGEDEAAADQSRRRIFRDRKERIAAFLEAAIEAGVARGELRPVESQKVAQLLIGMIWSATAAGGSGDGDVARDVTSLVLHGLVPRRERRDTGEVFAASLGHNVRPRRVSGASA